MDRKPDTADRRIAGIAADQYGVVSAAQLRAAGLSDDAVRGRATAGRLYRLHRGVYAVGHPAPAREGMWMAAILACGKGASEPRRAARPGTETRALTVLDRWGAALSHRSAAELWELLPPAEGRRVEVSIAGTGGKEPRHGIHVHRSRTLTAELVTAHRRIPATTPARTIADLRRAPKTRGCPASVPPWELRRAIRRAEVLGLPTGMEHLTERTRSGLEQAFLRLCRHAGLPRPEVNIRIGSLEVDFLWREHRLVVETDGYRYHRGRAAFEKDRQRDLELRTRGYDVVRLSENQISRDPRRVATVLRSVLSGDVPAG
jgi:very-short-patch-repair endonuclease